MSGVEKIDLYKLFKDQYMAPKKPILVEVGEAKYLTISGRGAPESEIFGEKIGALYNAAYTIKMTRKFAGEQDYAICKLECQWWAEGEDDNLAATPMEQWNWRLMIRTPEAIGDEDLDSAVEKLRAKGKAPQVRDVVLESLAQGLCVQMLHIGPYDREPETIAEMEAFAQREDFEFHGRHHEIYLSDPRRVPPERLRTILRHPVKKKAS